MHGGLARAGGGVKRTVKIILAAIVLIAVCAAYALIVELIVRLAV